MKVLICSDSALSRFAAMLIYSARRATEDSILAIQIFDQKKFKKKDQGFLGVINVRIGSVIDLEMGGDGWFIPQCILLLLFCCHTFF